MNIDDALLDTLLSEMLGTPPPAGDAQPVIQPPADSALLDGLADEFDFGAFQPGAGTATADNPPGTALGRAWRRGELTRQANVAAGQGDIEEGQALAAQAAQFPMGVPSRREVQGTGSLLTFIGERVVESAPQMLAQIGAGIAGGAVGGAVTGPAAPVGAAVGSVSSIYAYSTLFHTGSNVLRQIEEQGEPDWSAAVGYALGMAALDTVSPAKITNLARSAFTTKAMGAASRKGLGRELLEVGAYEALTEGVQTFLNQRAGDAENTRILFDPQTPQESERQDALIEELIESVIAGGVSGPAVAGGVAAASAGAGRIGEVLSGPPEINDPVGPPPGVFVMDDYLDLARQAESSGNPNAQSSTSSAAGSFGFIDSTWLELVKRHRPDLVQRHRTDAALLRLKSDDALSAEMAAHFTRSNIAALNNSGLPVNNTTVYMAHHFGPQGAVDLLTAAERNPNARVADIMSPAVMAANPYLNGKTLDDLLNTLSGKMGGVSPTLRADFEGDNSSPPLAPPPVALTPDSTAAELVTAVESRMGASDTFSDVDTPPRGEFSDARPVQTRDARQGRAFESLDAASAVDAVADRMGEVVRKTATADLEARRAEVERKIDLARQRSAAATTPAVQTRAQLAIDKLRAQHARISAEIAKGGTPLPKRSVAEFQKALLRPVEKGADVTPGSILQRLREFAVGDRAVPGLTKSQTRDMARITMRDFGYDPDTSAADLDVTKPSFRAKRAMSMKALVDVAFDPAAENSLAAKGEQPRELAETVRGVVSDIAESLSREAVLTETTPSGRAPTAAARKKAALLRRQSETLREGAQAMAELVAGVKQPTTFADDAARKAAVVKALSEARRVPGMGSNIDGFIRSYRRGAPPGFDPKKNVGVDRAFSALVAADRAAQRLASRVSTKAAKRDAPPPGSEITQQALTAAEQRQRALGGALRRRGDQAATEAEQRAKAAQERAEGTEQDRLAEEDRLRTVRRKRELAHYQEKAASFSGRRKGPMRVSTSTLALLTGYDGTPRDQSTPLKRMLPTLPLWAKQKLLNGMSMRQISESFNAMLPKVTFKGARISVVEALRRADQEGRSEGQTIARDLSDIGERIDALDSAEQEALGGVMDVATRLEGTLLVGGKVMSRSEFSNSFLGPDPADPNSTPGENFSVAARQEALQEAHARLLALSPEAQKLYEDTHAAYTRAREAEIDVAVAALARELYPNENRINTAKDVEFLKKVVAEVKEKSPATRDFPPEVIDRIAREPEGVKKLAALIDRSKVRGDYFPLTRTGNWRVFGSIDKVVTGRSEEQVRAQLADLKKTDPAWRPKADDAGRIRLVGDQWSATVEMPYYTAFQNEQDAQDFLTSTEADYLRSQGVRGLAHYRASSPEFARRALSDAQLATILSKAGANPGLRDVLIDLIPQAAPKLAVRDNVPGADRNPARTIADSGRRLGNAVAMAVRQDATVNVMKAWQESLESSRSDTTPSNIEKRNISSVIFDHMQQRNAFEVNLYEREGIAEAVGRLGVTATKIAVVNYLFGVSYIALNMAQPAMYGVPHFLGTYGAGGATAYAKNIASSMERITRYYARAHRAGESAVDYTKQKRPRDPTDPMTPLQGRNSNSRYPDTGMVFNLENTQAEYDAYAAGDVSFGELLLMSEARKLGAFGSPFFEAQTQLGLQPKTRGIGQGGVEAVTGGAGWLLDKGLAAVGYAAEAVEYSNRYAPIKTIYDMKATDALKNATPENFMDALAEARALASESDVLNDRINVDYTAANRSLLQKSLGPIMLFASFGLHFMYQTWRLAKAAVVGPDASAAYDRGQAAMIFGAMMGTHLLVGGLPAALPQWLMAPTEAVLSGLAMIFGDDEDEDDPLTLIRELGLWEYLRGEAAKFDPDLTNIVFDGALARAAGADFQSRVSLGTGYSFVEAPSVSEGGDDFVRFSFEMLGPIPAMMVQQLNAVDAFQKSGSMVDYLSRAPIIPKMGRDLAKSWKMGEDGLLDGTGKAILSTDQLDFGDALVQAIGFTPLAVSETYAKRNAYYSLVNRHKNERDDLLYRLRRIDSWDAADSERFYKDLFDFNGRVDPSLAIQPEGMFRSLMNAKTTEAEFGMTGGVPRDNMQALDRAMRRDGGRP